MSILDSSSFSRLEKLLAAAYDAMVTGIGVKTNPGSTLALVAKAKNIVRGGQEGLYGVVPCNPMNPNDASGVATCFYDANFYGWMPTTSVVINGKTQTVAAATLNLGPTAIDGMSVATIVSANNAPWHYTALVTVTDTSRLGGSSATYNIVKSYAWSGYNVATNNFDYAKNYAAPSFSPQDNVAVSLIHVTATGMAATPARYLSDMIYETPPSDDDIIEDIFPGVNSTEGALQSVDIPLEFRTTVNALREYTKMQTGLSFKDYWKSQGYTFSSSFRKLYASLFSDELSTVFGYAYAAGNATHTSSLTNTTTIRPCILEYQLLTALPSQTATAKLDMYLKTLDTAQNTGVINAGDATIMCAAPTWPNTGWVHIYNPYNNVGFVTSYSMLSATTMNVGTTLVGTSIPNYSIVNRVELSTAAVSPSVASGNSFTISVGSYIGLATAIVTAGDASAGFVIRSN